MEDFWGPLRERWPDREPRLHWHILPGRVPDVAALAGAYRELTASPGLDPVPPGWVHQTLYMIAPAAEVTEPQADQMVRQVRAALRLWAPMRITYGPAEISGQAVNLRVSPAEPAAQLHGAVLAAAAACVADRAASPPDVPYWGHVALAYANSAVDDGPLLAWLAAHHMAPVTITVRAVHLVRQTYGGHRFSWEPVATVPLGDHPSGQARRHAGRGPGASRQ
jgi:2'-5' RNA ligase